MKHESKEEINENINGDGVKQDSKPPEPSESCNLCGNHPCVLGDIQPTLVSILHTYGEWKTNKQVRFTMYCEATKFLHGSGLGKGVQKKLPPRIQKAIHTLAPDDKYTEFKEAKDCNK